MFFAISLNSLAVLLHFQRDRELAAFNEHEVAHNRVLRAWLSIISSLQCKGGPRKEIHLSPWQKWCSAQSVAAV